MADPSRNTPPAQASSQAQNKGPFAATFALFASIGTFFAFAEGNKTFQRFLYTTFDLDPIRIGAAAAPDNIGSVSELLRRQDELKSELKQARMDAERRGPAQQQDLQSLRGELDAVTKQSNERGQALASRDRDLQAARAAIADLEQKAAGHEARLRQTQNAGSSSGVQRSATSSPISHAVEAVTLSGNVQNSYLQAQLTVRFEMNNQTGEPLRWAVWGSNRAMASTDAGLSFNSVQNQNSTVPFCYAGGGPPEHCRAHLRALPPGASAYTIAFHEARSVANACDARKGGSKVDLSIPIVVTSGNALVDSIITGRVDVDSRITAQGC